jgi:histidinol-phosphate aminotransferase
MALPHLLLSHCQSRRPYDTAVTARDASGRRAREALSALPDYVPPERARVGEVRLDCNESPDGPFPAALAAIRANVHELHRYPRRDGELIDALAVRHALEPERIALGNGADALIGLLSAAVLERGDEVLMPWPSFPTYLLDARKAGADVARAPLRDGAADLDALAERIGPRTRLVWLCTPNNPTGGTVTPARLAAFLDAVPERVLVIVDEAYFEFAAGPGHADALREHVPSRANVGVLRTFSKIYGLAGLRIGWFAGPPELARGLGRLRHFYDIGELANLAAIASLADDAELERRRAANAGERARLEAGLRALGIAVLPSHANFVAARVGDGASLAQRLLGRGIAVRALDGLGEPALVRITVGGAADTDALLAALYDVRG